jgi:hypothetical protein
MSRATPHFFQCGKAVFGRKRTCGRCLLANLIRRRNRERDRIQAKRKDPAYRERERLAVSARMRRLRKARREATQHLGRAHV